MSQTLIGIFLDKVGRRKSDPFMRKGPHPTILESAGARVARSA